MNNHANIRVLWRTYRRRRFDVLRPSTGERDEEELVTSNTNVCQLHN